MNIQDMESADEQLTAYLDGELSAEEASALERQLVDSKTLRVRLAELRRPYEMLDELPETPHSQRFTKSTLELVIKDLTSTSQPVAESSVKQIDWFGWPRILIWIVGLVLLGALSGLALRAWRLRADMSDLGLIANFSGIKDVQELTVATKLSNETEAIAVLREHLNDRMIPPVPDSIWERKTWLKGLTPLQIAKLDSTRELIRKVSVDDYNRFAAIESQIESRPDKNQLQETLNIVGLVMDRLPASKRNDLESLNQEQRIQFLKEQISLSAAMYYASHMPTTDTKALSVWSSSTLHTALIEDLQPQFSIGLKDLLNLLVFHRRLENGYQLDNQSEVIEKLMPTLSETGRSLLAGVNRQDQLRVLFAWLVPERLNSNQVLLDAYDKINASSKERIDLVDPDQSRRLLEEFTARSGQ